jgi:hypothetical protein
VDNTNWFQWAINKYSGAFEQLLYNLLTALNELGGNASILLKEILTNPQLNSTHIEDMINKLNSIIPAGGERDSEAISRLKNTIDGFMSSNSQLDILNKLITHSSQYSRRVALFILSEKRTIGWLAWGFLEDMVGQIGRKKIEVNYSPQSIIFQVRDSVQAFFGKPQSNMDNSHLFQDLGGVLPSEIACIPLITKGRVSGILYLDQGGTNEPLRNIEELEILVMISGMLIDLIPIRKAYIKPTPKTVPAAFAGGRTPLEGYQPQVKESPASGIPQFQRSETASSSPFQTPQPYADTSPQQFQQPTPPFSPPPQPAEQSSQPFFEQTQKIPGGFGGEVQTDSSTGLPPFMPQQKIPDSQPPLQPDQVSTAPPQRTGTFGMREQDVQSANARSPMGFEISSEQIRPSAQPTNVIQMPGQQVQPSEEENRQKHDEAKRFARLLILEIKLYNEDKVMEGRKNKNLYSLLKEEIDRSREVFNERIDPSIRGQTSYFQDELVNILGGGDQRALGI